MAVPTPGSPADTRSILEAAAQASVLVDEHDLPRLVQIQEQLEAARGSLSSSGLDRIAECVEQSAALVQQVLYREAESASAALDLIRRGIEYAQKAVAGEQSGRTLAEIGPSPFEHRGAAPAPAPIDAELLASWISGCTGGLNELEALVVSVEGDRAPDDTLAEVRRRLHTLKGECGVLSLGAAQRLFHEAESAIDRCIETTGVFPADPLLSLLDWMKSYVDSLSRDPRSPARGDADVLALFSAPSGAPAQAPGPAAGPAPAAIPAATPAQSPPKGDDSPVDLAVDAGMRDNLAEFLCESREHLANSEQALLEIEKDPSNQELVNTVFRAFHTIKGVAGFLNIAPIVRLAHCAEFLLDAARSGRLVLDSSSLNLVLRSCDLMTQMLRALDNAGAPPTGGQLAALVDGLERATRGESPAADATGPRAATHASSPPAGPAAPAGASAPEPNGAPSVHKRADQTVKVSTGRMDALVDMVGELVIAQQMVAQDLTALCQRDQRVGRNLTMVGKIIRDLQEVSMSLRMVPVKATFQKMARLVRDVSAKAGKRITLHTEGEDVELDRTVVEEIADPLVHMIRNACDHGVEPPERRRAAGKPETGSIWLRAYHSGGSILIEVEDDGKGLDRDRIIAKAVEKGIYSPDRPVSEIPDAEAFNLVFLPGFSTAEKVTDLSGRGVGMDVVRRNIEALRGKVDITSTAGRGTIFTMRLPLTLAIIDGMVVRVGQQRYVIPTLSIERSFQAGPAEITTVVGRGRMARVRDQLIPIFRLDEILQGAARAVDHHDPLLIVVENQESRACLAVDEIIGQQQVVIKSLGSGTRPIRGVSGGAILGDGRVALILDIGGILSVATDPAHAAATRTLIDQSTPPRGAGRTAHTIA